MEAKLKQLEDQDIIEHVTGPTPWVSPLVIVDKPNGDVRLCVNMCKPNEALSRTHHPYPTSEEILQDLNGSKFFSKIDLKECYHQIELTEGVEKVISKQDLIHLLSVATKGQLFQFNGSLYEQVDGVAMGSPLGPLLANVFMSSIEEKLDVEGKLPPYNR